MEGNNTQNANVRPNNQQGQRPVRPNMHNGQAPVRPNIHNRQASARPNNQQGQASARPNNQQGQAPVRPNMQNGQAPVRPSTHNVEASVRPDIQNRQTQVRHNNQKPTQSNISNMAVNKDQIPSQNTEQFYFNDGKPSIDSAKHDNTGNNTKLKKKKAQNNDKKHKDKKEAKPKKISKIPKEPKLDEYGNPIKENKLKKYGIICCCMLVLILIAVITARIISTGNDKHITLAEKEPKDNTDEASAQSNDTSEEDEEDGLNISMSDIKQGIDDKEHESSYNSESPVVGTSQDVKIAVGSVITIPVTVKAQLDGDKEAVDYYSYITVKYNGTTLGYDAVKAEIDKHNTSTKHVVNIDDKEAFFKKNAGSDLVMYSFTFDIPSDFPTPDAKNKKVFISPSFGMSLEGSKEADKLITDKYTFTVPTLSPMTDDISLLHAGDSLSLNWIAVMPKGLDKSAYELYFKYNIGENNGQYKVESVTIPNNEETDEFNTNTSKQSTETTESTKKDKSADNNSDDSEIIN